MLVIHFTHPAANPLTTVGAIGASFLPLADGEGDTHISCLHLEIGGKIAAPSVTHTAALLIVHGRVTIEPQHGAIIDCSAGMGAVIDKNEPYSLSLEEGAIILIVESPELTAHTRAISTPQRIEGATWPSDSLLSAKQAKV